MYLFGTGDRDVPVTWTIQDNGASNAISFNSTIQQLYSRTSLDSASIMLLPSNLLTPGNTYLFQVSATNYLGTVGSVSWNITRESLPAPAVMINGPANLSILTSIPPSCLLRLPSFFLLLLLLSLLLFLINLVDATKLHNCT